MKDAFAKYSGAALLIPLGLALGLFLVLMAILLIPAIPLVLCIFWGKLQRYIKTFARLFARLMAKDEIGLQNQTLRSVIASILVTQQKPIQKLLQIIVLVQGNSNGEAILTGKELAQYLGCDERHVWRIIRDNNNIEVITTKGGEANRYRLKSFLPASPSAVKRSEERSAAEINQG